MAASKAHIVALYIAYLITEKQGLRQVYHEKHLGPETLSGTSEAHLHCVFVASEFGSYISESCEGVGGG